MTRSGCPRAARARIRGDSGFTIVELLVSTVVLMAVVGAVFTLVNPAQGVYRTEPDVSDMQQRLRVAVGALQHDLLMAGAGTYGGQDAGALSNVFAPVLPMRLGTLDSDVDKGVYYRPDAITLIYVPQAAAQSTIRDAMPSTSAELEVTLQPGCPDDNALCGFHEGVRAVIFDDGGAYDTFTVTRVQTAALHLQHRDDRFSQTYGAGAQLVEVAMHTYYLASDEETGTSELRHYDGYQTDLPFVDNVVGLSFEYLGDPHGPAMLQPASAATGPWTSYGPRPPALGVDRPTDAWPAGENCVFTVDPDTGLQVSRLDDLAPGSSALVPLTEAMLIDGPWCPDADAATRFDADLLRVRTIVVRLRVQVASAMLRGPAGALFARGGYSRGGTGFAPDQEVRFDVTPRNMGLGR